MVSDVKKSNPFKEPIKDLIDNYSQISDGDEKKAELKVVSKFQKKLGILNHNDYGN